MGASSESSDASSRCERFTVFVVIAVVVGFTVIFDSFKSPFYTMEITAISGLDPETDLRQSRPLSPAFNLTVGVVSHSWRKGAHIGPGTCVKVFYSQLRLPMATGHVPDARVGPGESTVLPSIVARGRDVAVPGYLMDSLAEEMRSGAAMFEVQLVESDEYGWSNVAKGWLRVEDTVSMTLC